MSRPPLQTLRAALLALCCAAPLAAALPTLDELALAAGTDKSSAFHHYSAVYAQHLEKWRHKPLKVLEIGVFTGSSIALWEQYFPNAELHFIDVDLSRLQHSPGERCHVHVVDQGDAMQLEAFAKECGGFDLIIDDGGHFMEQQITSFNSLFPHLNQGGLYIVEDLHTSYWKHYGGGGSPAQPASAPGSAVEFLKKLIDDLNFGGARTQCADKGKIAPHIWRSMSYHQREVASMHFYDSLCLIYKR